MVFFYVLLNMLQVIFHAFKDHICNIVQECDATGAAIKYCCLEHKSFK